MQSMPIDMGRLGSCLCVVPPEPRVNPEGEQRTDRDGNKLWVVGVAVRQLERRKADVIEIVVPGEPRGVAEGVRVRVVDLVAAPWEVEGRHGISYRAASITPVVEAAVGAVARGKGGDA